MASIKHGATSSLNTLPALLHTTDVSPFKRDGSLMSHEAYHQSEVPFVFGDVTKAQNFSDSSIALSKTMIDYW